MKGKLFLALLSVVFLCHAQTLAKGLSKSAKQKLEDRYQTSKHYTIQGFTEKKTILVLQRTGIVAEGREVGLRSTILGYYPVSSGWSSAGTTDLEGREIIRKPEFTQDTVALELGTPLAPVQRRFKNNRIELWCVTLDKYPVEGKTTFKTDIIYQRLYVKLRFFFDESVLENDDLDTIFQTIDWWVKPFPTEEEAKAFRDSLILAAVPEIKIGMTIADVESLFGIPSRKATLADKVIYKYEDMTVEFVDGKVSDVKF